ncbi:hypothetical protein OQI_16920 [Streptomyces pharetrae CZA14]|uniref:Uncharacterized protein n=1 Tax=Streptomyces pharetrae CZA14 TaxID=1144883 RepID=A0ABX3YHI1_9ACTN|nr:hypothetical protein OQI_16920 [Streptomyces pharetrae CZA14]
MEGRARDLVERESGCCSFFIFTTTSGQHHLRPDISVDQAHEAALDALAARTARSGRSAPATCAATSRARPAPRHRRPGGRGPRSRACSPSSVWCRPSRPADRPGRLTRGRQSRPP